MIWRLTYTRWWSTRSYRDGTLWVDTLSDGLVSTGVTLSSTQIDMAIGTVAAYYGRVVNEDAPRLQAELPLGGQRFQGVRTPISPPMFVIRKHLPRVFSLAEMVAQGTVTAAQAAALRRMVTSRPIALTPGTAAARVRCMRPPPPRRCGGSRPPCRKPGCRRTRSLSGKWWTCW